MDTDASDADAAAAERVRRELALLGGDESSAPEVPAEVTARIGAALRAAGAPAHSIPRPRLPRGQLIGLAVGVGAVLVGVGVAATLLTDTNGSSFPAGPTAQSITVSRPPDRFPLSPPEILVLLGSAPDYGPLAQAPQRAACLDGLGRPGSRVLGARPVAAGVVLVLPGDRPNTVLALLVRPDCSGLVADTEVVRP